MATVEGMPSTPPEKAHGPGRSRTLTLLIASASSVVAALVVSKIWGPGTLIGAAATPIIVTLVGDLLHRPAEKITVVRVTPSGTRVRERVDPADAPVGSVIAQDEMAATSVHRARNRRPLVIALVTGLVAFVIGALVLSTTELVFGGKLGSGGGSTTYFRGGAHATRTRTTTTPPAATGAAPTTTQTTTTTTTVPAPTPPPATATAAPPATTTPGPSAPVPPPVPGAAPASGATGP